MPDGVPVTAVEPPELKANPDGNVTTILPSAGVALAVVNETVTLPTTPAVRLAGVTVVEARAPAVMVTAATEVSWSIVASLELVLLI